jgi:hypothetical protein
LDEDLEIIRVLGTGALYVGGAVLCVWILGAVFALIDAWRSFERRRPGQRLPRRDDPHR